MGTKLGFTHVVGTSIACHNYYTVYKSILRLHLIVVTTVLVKLLVDYSSSRLQAMAVLYGMSDLQEARVMVRRSRV